MDKIQTSILGKKVASPVLNRKPDINVTLKSRAEEKPSTAEAVNGLPKPPVVTKNSGIADRMKQFEQKDGQASTSPSQSLHSLRVSSKPELNISPLSGRKFSRKDNVDDLKKIFGSEKGSPTPSTTDTVSSSDSKPLLPPKPSGLN